MTLAIAISRVSSNWRGSGGSILTDNFDIEKSAYSLGGGGG